MTDKLTRKRWPWAAVCIVAITAMYVGGYFALSLHARYGFFGPGADHPQRLFDYGWLVTINKPLGYIESTARGHAIELKAGNTWTNDGKPIRIWVKNLETFKDSLRKLAEGE